jgi:hypothetical protein
MMLSATICVRTLKTDGAHCAKGFHDRRSPCPFACHFGRLLKKDEASPKPIFKPFFG